MYYSYIVINTLRGLKMNKVVQIAISAFLVIVLIAGAVSKFNILTSIDVNASQSQVEEVSEKIKKINLPKGVHYKIGAKYQIKGITYTPKHEPDYSEVGMASWYGPGFHGKKTANGDVFNKWDLTAAHRTLPMYSKVWVTNVKTGKKIMVTINDRGPFAKDRIIDLSKKAAIELGFKDKGVAEVHVEYDEVETEKYLKAAGLFNQYLKKTGQQ